MSDRIGELLVQKDLLTVDQLRRARDEAAAQGTRLGYQITNLGYIDENTLAELLSAEYGVPSINLDEFQIDPEVVALVPEHVALKHTLVPVNRAGSTLIIATSDPSNIFALDDVKFLTGYNVEPVVAPEEALRRAIDRYYDSSSTLADVMRDFEDDDYEVVSDGDSVDIDELEAATEDAPVVKLVNLILTDAIKKSASDIHIEPYETEFRVRYRIDGVLYQVM
ncbi:MAG: type II secretion system protein GspE, partial [Myxococcota bacterium]